MDERSTSGEQSPDDLHFQHTAAALAGYDEPATAGLPLQNETEAGEAESGVVETAAGDEQPWSRTGLTVLLTGGLLTALAIVVGTQFQAETKDGPTKPPTDYTTIATAELLRRPLNSAICHELLLRNDITAEDLKAALLHLARERRAPELQVLLQLVNDLPPDARDSYLHNLTRLFAALQIESESLKDALLPLKRHPVASVRQIVAAVQMTVDQQLPPLQQLNKAERQEALSALRHVATTRQQTEFAERLQQLAVDDSTPPDVGRDVVHTIGKLRISDTRKAEQLIECLAAPLLREASLQAIAELPPESWPDDQLGFLAAGLISWLAELSPEQRQTTRRDVAVRLADELSRWLPAPKRARFDVRLSELLNR
ncbi:MAG: hypothetical protein Fues2KO_47830 [Fuerstiella sp.]